MADINVNGRIKIKTFQIQFLEKFPYLVPTLRTPDGKGIDNELTIAGARGIVRDKFLEDKKYKVNKQMILLWLKNKQLFLLVLNKKVL